MRTITTVILGSMTNALKAKRVLGRAGIKVNTIKIDESKSKSGCAHGIEILNNDFFAAIATLKKANIVYSVYES